MDEIKTTFQGKEISLRPNEVALILALRYRWRFGEVVVIMRDGVPQRLKRVEEFIDLSRGVDNAAID